MFGQLANKHGWILHATENSAAFNKTNLSSYHAVAWLNTTGNVLDDKQQIAFKNYVEEGGGYIGIHGASGAEYGWPWYLKLVGARFKSHPAIQTATVHVENKQHPSTLHLGNEWQLEDEWYNFNKSPRGLVNVLMSLDEASYNPGKDAMGDHPIAWTNEIVKGRAFYTALGHADEIYRNPKFIQHVEGGVKWASRTNHCESISVMH